MFFSCSEKKTSEVVPFGQIPELSYSENLGCSANRGERSGDYEKDTLFYQVQNDTLILVLNIFQNCGFQMEDSLNFKNDTVEIFVDMKSFGGAGCVCDFESDYYFSDYGDNVHFNVFVRYPYYEADYTFWRELNYP